MKPFEFCMSFRQVPFSTRAPISDVHLSVDSWSQLMREEFVSNHFLKTEKKRRKKVSFF